MENMQIKVKYGVDAYRLRPYAEVQIEGEAPARWVYRQKRYEGTGVITDPEQYLGAVAEHEGYEGYKTTYLKIKGDTWADVRSMVERAVNDLAAAIRRYYARRGQMVAEMPRDVIYEVTETGDVIARPSE